MKRTEEKFIASWEKYMAKGKIQFVIKSAIFWGLWMFVFMELFEYFWPDKGALKSLTRYLLSLGFWLISGIGFGLILWFFQTRRYKKLKRKQNEKI